MQHQVPAEIPVCHTAVHSFTELEAWCYYNRCLFFIQTPCGPIYLTHFKKEIYDVPMKFACKLVHGGPVRFCHRPL